MEPVIKNSFLTNYVKNIWVAENRDFEHADHSLKFFADGCPGLMFHQSESPMFLGDKELSTLLLYGQTVKPIQIRAKGSYKIIVFILHPYVLHSLFNIQAAELTDSCLDMSEFSEFASKTMQNLLESRNTDEQVNIMEMFIHEQAGFENRDDLVENAASFIMNSNGANTMRELQEKWKISERTFERRFSRYVGISPKLFSKICRFDSSVRQLEQGVYDKLSDIAYENGYADQSHFVRTFKEFTNETPSEYRAKK
jgi:AraC-like DNA-binding protein